MSEEIKSEEVTEVTSETPKPEPTEKEILEGLSLGFNQDLKNVQEKIAGFLAHARNIAIMKSAIEDKLVKLNAPTLQ